MGYDSNIVVDALENDNDWFASMGSESCGISLCMCMILDDQLVFMITLVGEQQTMFNEHS